MALLAIGAGTASPTHASLPLGLTLNPVSYLSLHIIYHHLGLTPDITGHLCIYEYLSIHIFIYILIPPRI